MKHALIPIHLIEFWYIEGFAFFTRTWKNLMLFLEEDLAVTLMWRLILVPLFHDSTIVGRILSILFRICRILMGLFAFALASLMLLLIAVYWFGLPILAVLDIPAVASRILIFSGIGLFIIHATTHPHKKVWSIRPIRQAQGRQAQDRQDDLWLCSTLKEENVKFAKLLKDREVLNLLTNLELQLDSVPSWEIKNVTEVAKKAYELARVGGSDYIRPTHYFVAALAEVPGIDNMLLKLDLKLSDFVDVLKYMEKKKQTWRRVYIWDEDFTIHHLKGVNRGWLGAPTPFLNLYSTDLTKEAASKGYPPFTREKDIVPEIVNILSQQTGRNVIIVGLPGSGKSSLIRHLARQIVAGDAPASLATKRLVMLDLTKLLSSVKTQGELAERIKDIFEEVAFAQNVIIVIEEIHELGMGEVGSSFNLYSLMETYLEQDLFQFIGTTEETNYSKILEKNASFARLFRKIELPQASPADTLKVLEDRGIEAERKNKIKVTFIALKQTVELSQKFVRDRVLPDSAISVLKEALTEAVNGWVTKDIIRRVISTRVKVPLMEVGTADKTRLLNLEEQMHQRLIDQYQAVKVVADSLRRAATGLTEDSRPIGSFLFVGPTGVGKTELAKTLADIYFKTEGSFLRFDMSEFQNPQSVVRLIGSEGEGGLLTEAVRSRPYALVLLDEFEKAHQKILTLFLQVLDDGRLTDGAGRTIGFQNTIIIATSNAGSLIIAQGLASGKTLPQLEKEVEDELLKTFKPELINRFDDVVIFKPLSANDLQQIVNLKLKKLQDRLKEKGYLVNFNNDLVLELTKRGFDPVMGARPLRRLIQDVVEAYLSKLILENKLQKGTQVMIGKEIFQER